MALKPYNGFTGAERDRAQRILRAAWNEGTVARPARCELCGQGRGIIDAHHEDYSTPLVYHPTCFLCHMMIHCRFRNPERWETYLRLLRDGARFPAFDRRDFPTFARLFLDRDPTGQVLDYGSPRDRLWADELDVRAA